MEELTFYEKSEPLRYRGYMEQRVGIFNSIWEFCKERYASAFFAGTNYIGVGTLLMTFTRRDLYDLASWFDSYFIYESKWSTLDSFKGCKQADVDEFTPYLFSFCHDIMNEEYDFLPFFVHFEQWLRKEAGAIYCRIDPHSDREFMSIYFHTSQKVIHSNFQNWYQKTLEAEEQFKRDRELNRQKQILRDIDEWYTEK